MSNHRTGNRRNTYLLSVVLMAVLTAVSGCGKDKPPAPEGSGATIHTPQPEDSIKAQIAKMTLDEKIGQLLLVGLDGDELSEPVKELIVTYHVGGFILYKNNVKDGRQLQQLTGALKEANRAVSGIPLWMSVDEEGGRVTRMPDELVKIPSAQKIGKANKPEVSLQIGQTLGDMLSAYGLNMDFAPVLDVNSNPNNPVIGDRSFGNNAELVGKLGMQTMKGLQSRNVIPVVKHFPGHGDTSVDSHVGLPIVNHDLDRLRSLELKPFGEAVRAGADAVMVAHILLPKLDSAAPASFSKAVVTDLLRKEMGFEGVVITDDLTMGAVVQHYDLAKAAVQSIAAGSDVLLVGHGREQELSVFRAVKDAAQAGTLPMQRIEESVYRILTLKQRYRLTDNQIPQADPAALNSRIRSVLGLLEAGASSGLKK
ncbi:beta-N-acetylhexosaminidase [Paenibacillus allorhizosphaerae]|uniref:Beta-hexosaminidase n=1 Tax=Paenibacillus allorhizosphaerae TaxID=2849866 RepID=A0ABN7TT59_9BACL|nr:beta-N-acetylhexosaminidase [Paenibacillus allorhizosphaerae]CAG7650072.1 Beta-hexosaminidase [Paenibacillus allorhizosphaerae]